jgi:hypothetical protein
MYDDLEYEANSKAKDDYPKDDIIVLESKKDNSYDEGPQRYLIITHN